MFSANVGFLFTDRPLVERIRAASATGFAAVECHYPYDTPVADLRSVLEETGLPMLSLNTVLGDTSAGDFGLAALPGREGEARAAIDDAVQYGAALGARFVHATAGRSDGSTEAWACYRSNLDYACNRAAEVGMEVLIEPINHRDVPGYHLSIVEDGVELIAVLGYENLKLMFDCYHVQIMQGDLTARLRRAMPVIGHIQIAAVPDRGEPDDGEVNYRNLIAAIRHMGFSGPIGAEYAPRGQSVEAGLGWLEEFRRDLG